MKTLKTTFTYRQLTQSNTSRLMSIYNRIFNVNAWEVFFNPYDSRGEMINELMIEMRAIKAAELMGDIGPVEKYQAVKVVVSPDGFAVLWNQGVKRGNQKVTDEQMNLIRELAADGETQKQIAVYVGVPQITVFRVLKGEYAQEATRWNTNEQGEIKSRNLKVTFKAATRKANYELKANADRPNNDFWQGLGL